MIRSSRLVLSIFGSIKIIVRIYIGKEWRKIPKVQNKTDIAMAKLKKKKKSETNNGIHILENDHATRPQQILGMITGA